MLDLCNYKEYIQVKGGEHVSRVKLDNKPRNSVYQVRVAEDSKQKAISRAKSEGVSLGSLVFAFIVGYANGATLPDWLNFNK